MFRALHFAARDPMYRKLVQGLVPYEENLKASPYLSRKIFDLIIPEIWLDGLRKDLRESLRGFVRSNQPGILGHIADIKKNKDAVIVHRAVQVRERFFQSVATAMIPYEEVLRLNAVVPLSIVKIVAELVDNIRVERARVKKLQLYLYGNKDALLKRISELNKKAAERDVTSMPEVGVIKEIEAVMPEIQDIEAQGSLRPQSSRHQKRHREVEEIKEIKEIETADQERLPSSPCLKRRRLLIDDLDFARWCLNKIRPIFCA